MGHRYSAFDCPCNDKIAEKHAKFPIYGNLAASRRQLVKLQFDGKSVTYGVRSTEYGRTDGRTNIKNLERPYTKSPFGAIKMSVY